MTIRHHDEATRPPADSKQRPIHHSPLFWIGIALCLAAILIYVFSEDLAWPFAG